MIIVSKKHVLRSVSVILIFSLIITMLPAGNLKITSEDSLGETQVLATEEITARIVGEITDERGEYSKTYLQDDGQFVTIFTSEALHYMEQGEWKDIDNTLQMITDEKTGEQHYQNSKNSFIVKLPETITSNDAIEINNDGYRLIFKIAGAKSSTGNVSTQTTKQERSDNSAHDLADLEKKSCKLVYESVLSDTAFSYTVLPQGLKEEIILYQEPSEKIEYRYTIETERLKAEVNEDKSISFYTPDKEEPVFYMPAPFMYDSKDSQSYAVNITLNELDTGIYELIYAPDMTWLKDSIREYPIIVDPVIKASKTTTLIDDAFVESGNPTSNYGSVTMLETGYSGGYTYQSFFYINGLPSLSTGSVVTSAKLNLYAKYTSVGRSVTAERVTSVWSEGGITYNTKPSTDGLISDCDQTTANDTWMSWDITAMTRDWYYGVSSNYGIYLRDTMDTSSTGMTYFYSSEYSDSALTPYIEITYRNNLGLESYMNYHSQDMGRAGTAYINDFTGNLVITRDDMGYNGNRLPVNVQMYYNAAASKFMVENIGYGYGWDVNYNQKITKLFSGTDNERLLFKDEDGTEHYFFKKDSNDEYLDPEEKWIDEDGLGYKVEEFENPATGEPKYILESGDIYRYFDTNNCLYKITSKADPEDQILIEYTYIYYGYKMLSCTIQNPKTAKYCEQGIHRNNGLKQQRHFIT